MNSRARRRLVKLVSLFACVLAVGAWADSAVAHAKKHRRPKPRPGCGQYCQNAGFGQGDNPPQPKCQHRLCFDVLTRKPTAHNGVVDFRVRCRRDAACRGAFILCELQGDCVAANVSIPGSGGRLAGSDFTVAAHATRTIRVAMTPLGTHLAERRKGVRALVLIALRGYGQAIEGYFRLHTSDRSPFLPGNATASCNQVLFVGPLVGCAFAQDVMYAYADHLDPKAGTIRVRDPVSKRLFTFLCTKLDPVTCASPQGPLVYFY